jgi:hypothetical protein
VTVPTLMAQLRRDFLIHAEKDGHAIFDALGAQEKELLWIENSNQRFYACNHFGQHPERLIGWFDRYMGGHAYVTPAGGERVRDDVGASR